LDEDAMMAGRSGDDDDDDIDAAAAARVPTGVATPSTSVDRSRVMFFFEKSAGVQYKVAGFIGEVNAQKRALLKQGFTGPPLKIC
jgi:hypothetical protein